MYSSLKRKYKGVAMLRAPLVLLLQCFFTRMYELLGISGTELFPDSAAVKNQSLMGGRMLLTVYSHPAVETWLAYGEFIDPG